MRGSKYRKADLQIHTPASKCMEDRGCTAKDIVEAAIQRGLEIAAVTDHNTAELVDAVRDAAKGTSLHVFPGVEITSGGGHILAIFDRKCPAARVNDLLAKVGILADMRGQTDTVGADAATVIREITALGGLAIAAHANSSNGILKNQQGQYRIKLSSMSELLALDFTSKSDVEKFTSGLVPQYPKKACVQTSDAHSLQAIGQRFVYLKMDYVSLNGIRQALLDHDIKVRFLWDDVTASHPRIVSLTTSQGFFHGTTFDFHPDLNCIVGGKGTGKSTAIELIRYVFDDLPGFDDIREDTLGKAISLVGPGGTITLECVGEDGEVITVERTVLEEHDGEPVCRNADEETIALPWYPVCFSQGELARVASSPLAQMHLIDSYVDVEEEDRSEEKIIQELTENAGRLLGLEESIAAMSSQLADRDTGKNVTDSEVKRLSRLLKDPVLKEFPAWEAEERFITDQIGTLGEVPNAVADALEELDIHSMFDAELPTDAPNAGLLGTLCDLPDTIAEKLAESGSRLEEEIKELTREADKIVKEWTKRFGQKKKQHKAVLAKIKEKTLAGLQKKLSSVKKRAERLAKLEKDLAKTEKQLLGVRKRRADMIRSLGDVRRIRYEKRLATVQRWEEAFAGRIKIGLVHLGDRQEYALQLKEMLKGSWSHEKDQRIVIDALAPNELRQAMLEGAVATVSGTGISEDSAGRIVEFLKPKRADLLELETVALRDWPEIQFQVEPKKYKPLNALSVGGKGTVVILLAMVEGRAPLIIDQPEDSLDTVFIYEDIVKKLRDEKESRQFIFATHNPNVLVSTDADLSFVLDATADKGQVKSHGGIDRQATNELLLLHLEGGEEAFRIRGVKYGKQQASS